MLTNKNNNAIIYIRDRERENKTMKNTEKEKLNINQFANEEQQLMNENSLYECLETYDEVISNEKIKDSKKKKKSRWQSAARRTRQL